MYADFRHRMPLRVRWAKSTNKASFSMRTICFTAMSASPSIGVRRECAIRTISSPKEAISLCASRRSNIFSAAYYDDELEVCGRIARLGSSSMSFVVEIYRRRQYEAVLVTAELIYVHADPASRTALAIPGPMRARIRV